MVLIRFSIFSFRHHHHAVDGGDYPSRVRRGGTLTGASRWTFEAAAGDRLPTNRGWSIDPPPGDTRRRRELSTLAAVSPQKSTTYAPSRRVRRLLAQYCKTLRQQGLPSVGGGSIA
jgi:hypothetical protein